MVMSAAGAERESTDQVSADQSSAHAPAASQLGEGKLTEHQPTASQAGSSRSSTSNTRKTSKIVAKLTLMVALIMVVGVIPLGIVSAVTGWEGGVKVGIYGYMVGLFTALLANRKAAAILVACLTVCVVVGAVASGSILVVALVITAGTLLIPIMATRAKIRPGIIAAMMIANGVSPAVIAWNSQVEGTSTFYLAIAGIVLFGGAWGALVGTVFRSKLPPSQAAPPKAASTKTALAGGIPLAIGTFLIAFLVGSQFSQYRWVWILAPLFSMMLAKGSGPIRTTRDLMIGSLVGTGIAVVLIQIPLPMMLEMVFGMVVLSASIGMNMAGLPYWVGASVSTAGVILMTGAGMDPTIAAESRMLFGFFGAILALVVGVVVVFCIRWVAKSEQIAQTS